MTATHSIPGHARTPDMSEVRPVQVATPARGGRRGLYVRFVTRMSGELSEAVAEAARQDGLTAGAFVRRMLLDRVGMQSARDARSGRPIRRPDEDAAAIAAAIRELASVSAAVAIRDEATAKAGLQQARALLIPLAVRRPGP